MKDKKNKQLRVAMIGQKSVPFYHDGGVDVQVEDLSTHLAKLGHKVTVYVRPRYMATKQDIWQGVRLIRRPSIRTKHLDTWTYTLLSSLHVLFQDVDIIHYHGVGPATLCWIPRLFKPRAKVVVTFHSIDRFHKKWGPIARLYLSFGEWAALRFPHATIAVSHAIQKYCQKRFHKKIAYIPNGMEIKKVIGADRLKKWHLQPQKYIITVARLVRHKGIHYLIEAFKKIPKEIRGDMKLLIAGASSYTPDYEAYLKEIASEDKNIIFIGFQRGQVLDQLYEHAYFYVHPSQAEGLSIAILEAMSFGRCALISDIPENLETIGHFGIPFKVSDVEDLKEKMIYFMQHKEIVHKTGEQARNFIKEKYNWERIVKKTEDLYFSL